MNEAHVARVAGVQINAVYAPQGWRTGDDDPNSKDAKSPDPIGRDPIGRDPIGRDPNGKDPWVR
jgi:hypothetical protein